MNFIAMITISQIDQMYFTSIRSHLKEELQDLDFKMPITNDKINLDLKKYLPFIDRILISINSVFIFAYKNVYFYAAPMMLYYLILWQSNPCQKDIRLFYTEDMIQEGIKPNSTDCNFQEEYWQRWFIDDNDTIVSDKTVSTPEQTLLLNSLTESNYS